MFSLAPLVPLFALAVPQVTGTQKQALEEWPAVVGSFTAVSGDTLVTSYSTDQVIVYVRQGTAWVEQAILQQKPPVGGISAVDIEGDVLVTGASYAFWEQGAAFIFRRQGTTWTQEAFKKIPPGAYAHFGAAVLVAPDETVFVGAPGNQLTTHLGIVSVYDRSTGGVWRERAQLKQPQWTINAFGGSLALSEDTLVVGSDDLSNFLPERAIVFTGSGTTWTEQAGLDPSDADGFERAGFGASVAIDGDTILVGSPSHDELGKNSGAAYVYTRSGTEWTERAKLQASDPKALDHFGSPVQVRGDLALLGASLHDHQGVTATGAVYAFVRSGDVWSEKAELGADDPSPGRSFGQAIEWTGTDLWIGAPNERVGVTVLDGRGAAFDPGTGRLFVCDSFDDQLVQFEPLPEGSIAVGPLGVNYVVGLAYDPAGGVLYGMDGTGNRLLEIDTVTGAATPIGAWGSIDGTGLAFHPGGGFLYTAVCSSSSSQLLRVDPATGGATVIASLETCISGLAYDATAEVLYGIGGSNFRELFRIDKANGATTLIGEVAPSGLVQGLAFDPATNLLYGPNQTSREMLVIDPATGVSTSLGPYWARGILYDYGVSYAETYCTAGLSANGCQPAIAASGTPSATAPSGFTLSATAVEGQRNGFFIFSANGRQANPWGNGSSYVCVVPPRTRSGLLTSGGAPGTCTGTFTQDLNALWCPSCPKPGKNLGAGAVGQAQLYYRDRRVRKLGRTATGCKH